MFQIGNARRGMRLHELYSIVAAAFWLQWTSRVPSVPFIHTESLLDGQTIPSSPRDVVRDGGGQSSDTQRQPFTQLFQSAAKLKHILLPLIAKIETQLMKTNLGSPPQGLQHGLFHCKYTFIYTLPAPVPMAQISVEHTKQT